jgi:DNA-binding response OmpR family regulator
VPVLLLTARDGSDDKIARLTVGGDDYVTKPFSLAEVVARTRAILRRTGGDSRGGGAMGDCDSRTWCSTRTAMRCGGRALRCG